MKVEHWPEASSTRPNRITAIPVPAIAASSVNRQMPMVSNQAQHDRLELAEAFPFQRQHD